jgi:hypothetical protein
MVGAMLPSAMVLVAVSFGLRSGMLPSSVFTMVLIALTGSIGIATAWLQCRYLIPPLDDRSVWMRGALIGWLVGSIVHGVVSTWFSVRVLAEWMGSAAAYMIAGIIMHGVLAYFAV